MSSYLRVLFLGVLCATLSVAQNQQVWINEIHYRNRGSDLNEFVELAVAGDFDLTGYQLVQYAGFNGMQWGSPVPLSDNTKTLTDNKSGYAFHVTLRGPSGNGLRSSLRNGKQGDGIALVDTITNTTVQFISWGGSFIAEDGIAAGATSTDIGVEEERSSLPGHSVSLTGEGPPFSTWTAGTPATPGFVNHDQTINVA
mmetsp:Transcript_4380/g.6448  ORF Transcript_4380/g.6448 Transcript_4380/m.6448 type:complete len:198 (+) Transcript_4380:93-686(+)